MNIIKLEKKPIIKAKMKSNKKIAIVGLGYVGLPLARLFATKYPVVGFDINQGRVLELNTGTDSTLEVEDHILQNVGASRGFR